MEEVGDFDDDAHFEDGPGVVDVSVGVAVDTDVGFGVDVGVPRRLQK